jgi:hypothetical protein
MTKNFYNMDCTGMIQETSKEVKTLLYKCNKIVCGDDVHITMERDEMRDFEIIEGTSIFIRIPIIDRIPPIKISFDYLLKGGDLKVCMSKKSK